MDLLANSFTYRDKFLIYQGRKGPSPVIRIGSKPLTTIADDASSRNPIRRARYFQTLLDDGIAESHQDLAGMVGLSRTRISTVLNLLNLDAEIQRFVAELDETDPMLDMVHERNLRPLAGLRVPTDQKRAFDRILGVDHSDSESSPARLPSR